MDSPSSPWIQLSRESLPGCELPPSLWLLSCSSYAAPADYSCPTRGLLGILAQLPRENLFLPGSTPPNLSREPLGAEKSD